jgi:hypothetical protein
MFQDGTSGLSWWTTPAQASTPPGITIRDGTLHDPVNPGGSGVATTLPSLFIRRSSRQPGSGYNQTPTVTISDPNPAVVPAIATAALDNGAISAIRVKHPGSGYITPGGIRKFVDTLPGLTSAGINNLGQYIPLAVADTASFPGADYYEIAVVEYEEKMHSDLPPTKLRGTCSWKRRMFRAFITLYRGHRRRRTSLSRPDHRGPEGQGGQDHFLQPAANRRRRRPVPAG